MESSSVIVLDSDSDDGVSAAHSRTNERKRNASSLSCSPLNGTSSVGVVPVAPEPQRKRIKPTTIASNLSSVKQRPGSTPPHNNNNQPVIESFASITYSEDWEQEIKEYQQKLAGDKRKTTASGQTTSVTPTSSRSSTNDEQPEPNSRSTPGPITKCGPNPPTNEKVSPRKAPCMPEKNPIGKEFQELLDACRKADNSKDMETLIEKKLVRYYEIVHPDYVNSKSFKKAVVQVTADVRAHPNLVFLKLANIVEELNVRRKSRPAPPSTSETDDAEQRESVDSSKKDRQITKLNRTLYILTKRIQQMEEADVDFSHEINSAYVMAERYKKRAYLVYQKLCDITGESKNAQRLVRKPISFQATAYTEFNRKLSQFVNQMNTFPNFREVLKCLQFCDTKYEYRLRTEEMERIAQEAFIKIGKQLQKRRKTDLYETVAYHAGDESDPAISDAVLRGKLEENGRHYSKVNEIIDKFAKKELTAQDEEQKGKSMDGAEPGKAANQTSESMPSSSKSKKPNATVGEDGDAAAGSNTDVQIVTDTDDDDDDDGEDDDEYEENDEDEDEDEFESTTKENVRPDSFEDVVISDDDELVVLDS